MKDKKKHLKNKLTFNQFSPEEVIKALLQTKPENITKKQAMKKAKKK